jgi:hypothetical protein
MSPICGELKLKHDSVRNCTEACSFGAGKALGKFVFHPSSPDAAEDFGVLMGFVYGRLTDRSELAIIDARPFATSRASSCRIEFPQDFTATGYRAPTNLPEAPEHASDVAGKPTRLSGQCRRGSAHL